MDQQMRHQVCELIAGVISSDQEVDEGEADFLQRVRARFGVPKGTEVKPTVDRAEAVAKLAALPAGSRKQVLDLLIQAATVDGKIVPAERELLGALAGEMGIGEDDLDLLLVAALDG
jgi:uncharacterized tellurite resistance protein B-like protein